MFDADCLDKQKINEFISTVIEDWDQAGLNNGEFLLAQAEIITRFAMVDPKYGKLALVQYIQKLTMILEAVMLSDMQTKQ